MPLIAKLSRPRLAGIARRERLLSRMQDCLSRASLWICGPPGAGKTTLAASYLEARALPAIWYQVDTADVDVAGFFYYLALAARQTGLSAEAALPMLKPEHLADLGAFARRFFRLLFADLAQPCALVFDNCHEVPESAPLHDILREAVTETAANVTIVFVSRTEPPLAYARLRASRQLLMLGWDELRLDTSEIEQIAAQTRGLERQRVEPLRLQCDGWVAGLILLLSRPGDDRIENVTRTPQVIFDYFARELFDRLPAATRDVLLQTSLLPSFTLEMAYAAGAGEAARDALDTLHSKHLFITVHSTTPPTYQYHVLFRKFLISRLHATRTPNELSRLTRRSARALAKSGQIDTAIETYSLAGDHRAISALILAHAAVVASHGRFHTLESWITRLPDTALRSTPWLTHWLGVCRVVGDPPAGRKLLERAFRDFGVRRDTPGQVRAASAIIDSLFWEFESATSIGRWIVRLGSLLERAPRMRDPALELSAHTSLLLAALNCPAEPRKFALWVDRITALMERVPEPNARVRAGAALLVLFSLCGRTEDALELRQRVARDLESPDLSPLLACQWLMPSCWCRLSQGDSYAVAAAEIEAAARLAEAHGLAPLLPLTHLVHGLLCLGAGDGAGARAQAARASVPARAGASFNGMYETVLAGAALLQGNTKRALQQAQAATRVSTGWMMQMTSTLYLAYAHCASGEHEKALSVARQCRHIHALLGTTDNAGPNDAGLPEAYALLMLGKAEEAESLLRERLGILARARCVTATLWMGSVMSRLFAFALARDIERDYVLEVIGLRQVPAPSQDVQHWPWPVRVRTLGQFEVLVAGEPLPRTRKPPKRLLLILKTLIALGGQNVPEQRLADEVWPEQDGDSARNALATGIHRLRKLLRDPRTIDVSQSRVSLDARRVWVDCLAFEQLAAKVRDGAEDDGPLAPALELYRGAFLPDEADLDCAAPRRDMLRTRFIRLLTQEARRLEESQPERAAALYARGIDVEPLGEAFYQGLMRCHQKELKFSEALRVYERLRRTLQNNLGVPPSPVSESLRRASSRA